MKFQLFWPKTRQSSAHRDQLSCSHHSVPFFTVVRPLFTLLFSPLVFSLSHFLPTRKRTATRSTYCLLPFRRASSLPASLRDCTATLGILGAFTRLPQSPCPACQLKNCTAEAEMIISPCHASAEHRNTIHEVAPVFGQLFHLQKLLPVARVK